MTLVLGGFALVLAVAGLAVGVEPVPRLVELMLFAVACVGALAAMLLAFRTLRLWEREQARQAERQRITHPGISAPVGPAPERRFPLPGGVVYLVGLSLVASLGVAAVRPQEARAQSQGLGGAKHASIHQVLAWSLAIKHLQESKDPGKRMLGNSLLSFTGAVAGAGLVLAPAALGAAAEGAEGVAAAGAGTAGGVLDVVGALARGIRGGISVEPQVRFAPTFKVDPTLRVDHPEVNVDPTLKIDRRTFRIELPKLSLSLNVRLPWSERSPHRRRCRSRNGAHQQASTLPWTR